MADIRPILCAKNKDQMKKLDKNEDCFILEFDPYDEIISKLSLSTGSDEAVSTDFSVDVSPILCAKNREQMKKLEKEEDCFILEFDPYDEIDISKLSLSDEAGSSDLSLDVRLILCAKNREQMKKLDGQEDCFILEFDPYDEIDMSKLSVSKCSYEASPADLCVVAEKGQVACRDYPHSRHNCAKYHFEKTPHDRHCKLCFCYVCDSDAPCPMWLGSSGHCHAFNTELWNKKREDRKLKVAFGDYPHFRHNCAQFSFDKTPHDNHCKQCYCYVCDSCAPCQKWFGSSGHCHAFKSETWDKKREEGKLKVAHRDLIHFRNKCKLSFRQNTS